SPGSYCIYTSRANAPSGLSNPTPYSSSLYYTVYCYAAETTSITVGGSGTCNWGADIKQTSGDGYAQGTGTITCSNTMPNDMTSRGDLEIDDWSGNNVGGQTWTGTGGRNLAVQSPPIRFPDRQQT